MSISNWRNFNRADRLLGNWSGSPTRRLDSSLLFRFGVSTPSPATFNYLYCLVSARQTNYRLICWPRCCITAAPLISLMLFRGNNFHRYYVLIIRGYCVLWVIRKRRLSRDNPAPTPFLVACYLLSSSVNQVNRAAPIHRSTEDESIIDLPDYKKIMHNTHCGTR